MRLKEDQVKQAILHDDRDLRDAAVYFFSRSYSNDPGIMPLAIQVIERRGWADAFETYSFLKDVVQTDEAILWLIAQIKKCGEPQEEFSYVHALHSGLAYGDANLLKHHDDTILHLHELKQKARDTIRQRIHLASQSPDDLWLQLDEFCRRSDKLTTLPQDLDLADDLVEALGRYPEFSAPKVLAILNAKPANNWMELCAVRLAGELRLQEAIPSIVAFFDEPDDWIIEEGHRALSKIGGDKVVEELARACLTGGTDLRSSAANILENIHSDLSVETCLKLFETEEEHHIRCSLLQSVLMNFATEGIEPARQFILGTPLDPDVLEVRSDLLTACKMLGETFLELSAWKEESNNDVEFRKDWYRKYPLSPGIAELELDEDDDLDEQPLAPSSIIREVRIGRNDPCPCGSGKKFKKCCLNKAI